MDQILVPWSFGTCELNAVEAFDYLTVLHQHLNARKVAPGAALLARS